MQSHCLDNRFGGTKREVSKEWGFMVLRKLSPLAPHSLFALCRVHVSTCF